MAGLKWQKAAIILTIAAGAGILGYAQLFGVLFQLSGVNATYSGDQVCGFKCESYINVTTSYWRICFAHYKGTKYENQTLFKKVSRSRTLHVNLDKVEDLITTDPRVPVGWFVPTYGGKWRPIKDGDCWERGKINRIKLVGYKPLNLTVKWGFGLPGKELADPLWIGYSDLLGKPEIVDQGNLKKLSFPNLLKDVSLKDLAEKENFKIDDLFKLEKKRYFGDAEVKLMEKINVTETLRTPYKCNCRNETGWKIDNRTKKNTTYTYKTCDTCYNYTNKTREVFREINPENFVLRKDKPIYEVFEGCRKIERLPNGKWGCSVWTDVYILGQEIKGLTWWNSSWSYRQPINISNTAGDLTNYQVKIDLNSSNVGSNFNWSNNGSDIRFTNSTDDELNFWIESWDLTANTSTIWVNMTSLPNNTNTTIYMYYGNPSASSASDGEATFEFFDDFPGTSLDSNKWSGDTSYASVSNSELSYGGKTGGTPFIYSTLLTPPMIMEGKIKLAYSGAGNSICGFRNADGSDYALGNIQGDLNEITTKKDGSKTSANSNWENNVYMQFKLVLSSSEAHFYKDNVERQNSPITTNVPVDPMGVAFGAGWDSATRVYSDYVFVRKYADPEPTVSSFGSEETSTGAPIISNKTPSSPIIKEPQSSDFNISATIDQVTNNHWELNNGSGYTHLEWDNNTDSPVYLCSPSSLGVGNYTIRLTAFNITNSSSNSSTTWSLKITNITISSPNPSSNASFFVRNRSITYSATVNVLSNNKWIDSLSSEVLEWDNGTTSPSYTAWINNSSIDSFNISLISYSVETGANTSFNWTNSIIDNTFNSNFTWKRLHYFPDERVIRWSNLICGDADNDGLEECLARGEVLNYFYVIELNGSVRNVSRNHAHRGYKIDIHDANGDGNYDLIFTGIEDDEAKIDFWQLNSTNTVYSNPGNIVPVTSDNPHGIAWFNISGNQEFYSAFCGGGEVVRIKINQTSFSTSTIDTVPNSGEDTLTIDIDNDGVDELIVTSGFSSGTAKIYVYEINNSSGSYTSKTLILSQSLDNSTHFSAYIVGGDVDNDNVNNLIVLWEHSAAWGDTQARIESYEFNTSYGVGNYTEGFTIDNGSHLEDVETGSNWAVIGDIDGDDENEFVYGVCSNSHSDPGAEAYLYYWDIASNGTNITRHIIGNFTYFFEDDCEQMIAPAFVNDSGTQKLAVAVSATCAPSPYTYYSDVFLLSLSLSTFSITLNSPPNQTTTDDSTPDFNFTVSGTESSYSCELFINDSGYGTATANNNTATVITANQSLSNGVYNWYINCTAGGVTNQSEVREITISANTCSCPGLNQNWQIDLADNCMISSDCDLGTGNLSFTGEGDCYCNATINASNLTPPPNSSGTLWILSNCRINIG